MGHRDHRAGLLVVSQMAGISTRPARAGAPFGSRPTCECAVFSSDLRSPAVRRHVQCLGTYQIQSFADRRSEVHCLMPGRLCAFPRSSSSRSQVSFCRVGSITDADSKPLSRNFDTRQLRDSSDVRASTVAVQPEFFTLTAVARFVSAGHGYLCMVGSSVSRRWLLTVRVIAELPTASYRSFTVTARNKVWRLGRLASRRRWRLALASESSSCRAARTHSSAMRKFFSRCS